jgi:5-amino-6-(5-phosphoribosylamino)uracil reductase
VADRPYVLVSCAMSIDGYIDDATDERLLLSNDADFDRVDEVRAGCDAILVGANTIRRDNPRLLIRSPDRRRAGALPAKVTLTGHGDLDPAAAFFAAGDVDKLVYCGSSAFEKARHRLAGRATVVDAGDPVDLARVLADLAGRGVRRLLVEGGSGIHTGFLTAGLADELHLVVAPFFVGDCRAPRFVGDGTFPWTAGRRARLVRVEQIDDVVLLRYALSDRCPADAAGGDRPGSAVSG